jgi:hypothetical protein
MPSSTMQWLLPVGDGEGLAVAGVLGEAAPDGPFAAGVGWTARVATALGLPAGGAAAG